ncbi:MAG: rhomboid family intramembrane serine protease [Gemmataceae bacterium]|nr:rhomboid family intramembrane serine protease [Gemmataceae bacterium]
MGIHDRDYYRDAGRGMFDAWGRWGVTTWLIVVTSAAWVAQLATGDRFGPGLVPGRLTAAAIYDPDLVLEGQVWRLVTCVFLHGEMFHLFFNMLALYFFGPRLEDRYGGAEFLLFYLLAGTFASVVMFAAQVAGLDPPGRALGASGAVTAVLVLYACHYPRQQVLLFFVIPVPIWLVVVLYVGLDAFGAFGAGQPGVAYTAHLGGALFGLLYYQTGIRFASVLPGGLPARRPAATRLRVVPIDPDEADTPIPAGEAVPVGRDEPLEDRVNAVLDKVSRSGQGSLTAEEREILFRASEHYKRRRK